MIHFQKIRFKNFLSVGDQPIEINFENQQTLLVRGANGSGKSCRKNTNVDVWCPDPEVDTLFNEFLLRRKWDRTK